MAAKIGALVATLVALAGWPPAGLAAGVDASLPGRDAFRVLMEHLVIRPAGQEVPGGYEVLDVVLVEPGGEAEPAATFTVSLFPGHESVRVLDGFEAATVEVGPRSVSGLLVAAPGSPATVAVLYRLGPDRANGSLTVVRPYPVQTLRIIVHPAVRLSVGGADPEGEVELAGVSYRLYTRQDLPAGTPVVLSPARPAGGTRWAEASPSRPAILALAVGAAAALAAVGWLASRRRLKEGLARERERLVDEVLALEAEYAGGYLEEPEFRRRRQEALARLARILWAQGPLPSGGARAGGGPPGGTGP